MSDGLVPDFYRGDSLNIGVTLTVDEAPLPIAGATLTAIVRLPGGTAAKVIDKSVVVPAGANANAGKAVIPLLQTDTLVPPSKYMLYLVYVMGAARWTFHEQPLIIKQGGV